MDLKEKTIFSMLIQNLKQQHEIILVNILKLSYSIATLDIIHLNYVDGFR